MAVSRSQWPVVDAGDLRHQVQIQSRSTSDDSFGQPQATWSTVRAAYASIVNITSREIYQAGMLTSQLTHMITVRWSPTVVAPGMRVLFGSRVFQVQACVNVLEMNALVKMLCLELSATS
jgi:SPP1 family predicted phage head-tail adaptor